MYNKGQIGRMNEKAEQAFNWQVERKMSVFVG